ncbi:PAS domain S-box protein [Roseomonas nepalensis]|uniref:histidine kinase n=1 Tax=Muricoccus nepalensis TaxID=1854500 RepID=A0A502F9H8_9PROT|nr:PAS domain S-box protein [Roseomonas nepalensis]TPG46058.1 PAS domain S-box protein [Roseomonas nepalensis]
MSDFAGMLKRQKILGDFGEFALRSEDLDQVLHEACRLISEALGTDRAKILEILPAERQLFVRAGVGWDAGIVGELRISMEEHSSESFAINSGGPVITQDMSREDRFEVPSFMRDAGVVALVNVPIFLPGQHAFGLLQVDDIRPREFGEHDISFLRTYSAILGPLINRLLVVGTLRSSEERFRLTVAAALDYAIFTTDAMDRITDWLPGAQAVFGWTAEEAVGQPAALIFTPEDRENNVPEWEVETARREGVAPNVRWHLRKDGVRVFIEGSTTALRGDDGRIQGYIKIGQDVTARKADEERQTLLMREVDHRAKNALSVVNAALRLTRAPDLPSYVKAIEGRIDALVRAQTLLADDRWDGADLLTLLRGELATFLDVEAGDEAQVEAVGPSVRLPAGAAQPLGMAIHELATNAMKYGGLSTPAGRVAIHWTKEGWPTEMLRLCWLESGGPPVEGPPEKRGFGTRVLDGTVRGQLRGAVSLAWHASGLVCQIEVPLSPGPQRCSVGR